MTEGVRNYRDQISALGVVPRWLRGRYVSRLLYTIGLHVDLLRELLLLGLTARFPGYHRDATPYLCRDLKVQRGPEESEEQITARLRARRQTATTKGNTVSILRDLQAYLMPHAPRIRVVDNSGHYVEISREGAISEGEQPWNWDGNTALWSRYWVLIWPPPELWQNEGNFGDPGLVGDGGVIGSTATPAVVAGVRAVIADSGSPNSRHVNTIVIWDDDAWLTQQPDGTWDRFGQRNPTVSYWAGDRS